MSCPVFSCCVTAVPAVDLAAKEAEIDRCPRQDVDKPRVFALTLAPIPADS